MNKYKIRKVGNIKDFGINFTHKYKAKLFLKNILNNSPIFEIIKLENKIK